VVPSRAAKYSLASRFWKERIMFRALRIACFVLLPSAILTGCNEEPQTAVPEVRPVRTVTVEETKSAVPVVLTGRIQALDEASLGFRISGRMIERAINVGDRFQAGQLLARLEPHNELNALRSTKANLAAAQAKLTQVSNHFDRQQTLLSQGWTTRANFDQAKREMQTAEAQVESAEAQLEAAHDQVSFTELKADAEGVVTAVGAEPGEVVQAGQMIVRLARQGGRDAVFDVPAQVLRSAPNDPLINVRLTDDATVSTTGRVREVAPQADPVTRTFQVKVGLSDPPEAMRLGATVTGTVQMDAVPVIEIPASALTKFNGDPAVWVVDPTTLTVATRNVEVLRFDPATVTVSQGLDKGDVVVTAGVQALRPGQKVRLLGSES
jgi:RND family efflux transporter MFP subunit